MSALSSVFGSQSFPSIDPRVGWALTVLCLLMSLLIMFGVLQINVGPLSSWVWVQIVAAQAVTAVLVGSAAHLSSRRKSAKVKGSERDGVLKDQPSA